MKRAIEVNVNIPTAIELLEKEWNIEETTGVFGQLKANIFDDEGFQRVKNILDEVELPVDEKLNKRFVELTWYIPTYLHWQRSAWVQDGQATTKLDEAIDFFEMRLTTILGLP